MIPLDIFQQGMIKSIPRPDLPNMYSFQATTSLYGSSVKTTTLLSIPIFQVIAAGFNDTLTGVLLIIRYNEEQKEHFDQTMNAAFHTLLAREATQQADTSDVSKIFITMYKLVISKSNLVHFRCIN